MVFICCLIAFSKEKRRRTKKKRKKRTERCDEGAPRYTLTIPNQSENVYNSRIYILLYNKSHIDFICQIICVNSKLLSHAHDSLLNS